jgi:hypothetical protein
MPRFIKLKGRGTMEFEVNPEQVCYVSSQSGAASECSVVFAGESNVITIHMSASAVLAALQSK